MPTATLAPRNRNRAIKERWKKICEDPSLAALPYKIELQDGQIIMSPPPRWGHGYHQMRFGSLFERHAPHGVAYSEVGVMVPGGVRVPDVVWSSTKVDPATLAKARAPEICIEIHSPSNTERVLTEKRKLYFDAGAKEVWIVGSDGTIAFFTKPGSGLTQTHSKLIPDFPTKII